MKKNLRTLILVLFPLCAAAQSTPELKALLQKVQYAYKSPAYLAFSIRYAYSNAAQAMDTLSGQVWMDKGRTRFVIGDKVNLVSGPYALQIVPTEKLIYVTKAGNRPLMDPTGPLDSLMHYMDKVKTALTYSGGMARLSLVMPRGSAFLGLEMTVDTATGWLKEMTYDVSTIPEGKGKVKVEFSDYSRGTFGDSLFDPAQYFTRVGKTLQPTTAYKDYKIFLASSLN